MKGASVLTCHDCCAHSAEQLARPWCIMRLEHDSCVCEQAIHTQSPIMGVIHPSKCDVAACIHAAAWPYLCCSLQVLAQLVHHPAAHTVQQQDPNLSVHVQQQLSKHSRTYSITTGVCCCRYAAADAPGKDLTAAAAACGCLRPCKPQDTEQERMRQQVMGPSLPPPKRYKSVEHFSCCVQTRTPKFIEAGSAEYCSEPVWHTGGRWCQVEQVSRRKPVSP